MMMNKLYTIQTNVPICPECGGGLKHKQIVQEYQCYHCGSRFRVLNQGQTERELVCEKKRVG